MTAACQFPNQLAFLWRYLPVIRLWSGPDAQIRLQLNDVPYDLLRAADAILPRHVTVLLITSGRDVRHREYTMFHRTLYFLAPRPVWWLTPARPDGTWESRLWVSAPLTPESVHAIAAEKGASYILAYDLPQPLAVGQQVADLGDGSLLQLDEGVPSWSERPVRPTRTGTLWPIRLAAALGTILLLGYVTLGLIARIGYRPQRIEGAALAWPLGAGLASVGMLWLNALGMFLNGQIMALTLLAVGAGVWTRVGVRSALNSQLRVSNTRRLDTKHPAFRVSLCSHFAPPLLLRPAGRFRHHPGCRPAARRLG